MSASTSGPVGDRLLVSPEKFTLVLHVSEDVSIQVQNPNLQRVVFKFKTTRPDRFVVRPRLGMVKPQSSELISISLNRNVSTPGDDQFQVEYRMLDDREVVGAPSGMNELLKSQSNPSTGERIKATLQRKLLFCSILDATPEKAERVQNPPAQVSPTPTIATHTTKPQEQQQQSQDFSTSSNLSANVAPEDAFPTTAKGEEVDETHQMQVLNTELQSLDVSVADSKEQIAQEKELYEALKSQRDALSSLNASTEAKIAVLERQVRVARHRSSSGFRVPWPVGLLMIVLAWLLVGYWKTSA